MLVSGKTVFPNDEKQATAETLLLKPFAAQLMYYWQFDDEWGSQ